MRRGRLHPGRDADRADHLRHADRRRRRPADADGAHPGDVRAGCSPRSASCAALGALLTADLAQAAPRASRDRDGRPRPAFAGSATDCWRWCVAAATTRAPLQRVEYRLHDGRLERLAYRPGRRRIARGRDALARRRRARLRLRYRDREGGWRDAWDPTDATLLPRAVELVSDSDRPTARCASSSWSGAGGEAARFRARERGAALLAVLLLVAVTGAIAAAAMEGLRLSRAVAANATALDQARAFADGVEQLALLTLDDRIAAEPGADDARRRLERRGAPRADAGRRARRDAGARRRQLLQPQQRRRGQAADARSSAAPPGVSQFIGLMMALGTRRGRRAPDRRGGGRLGRQRYGAGPGGRRGRGLCGRPRAPIAPATPCSPTRAKRARSPA